MGNSTKSNEENEIIYEGHNPDWEKMQKLNETDNSELEKYICKINGIKGIAGTGFFAKLDYNNSIIPVLITNYHVINDKFLSENNTIKIYINNIFHDIHIDNDSKIYSSDEEKYDIMIIKLNEENSRYDCLDIDTQNIMKQDSESSYENEQIYILHYPFKKKGTGCISYGNKFKKRNEYQFEHYCDTDKGSSGGPILSSQTHKIIGIHRACMKSGDKTTVICNIGTFLKYPLIELNENNDSIKYIENITLEGTEHTYTRTSKFLSLDDFENCVLNYNRYMENYYILSKNYKILDPSGIMLSKISIFDKDRGTVKKDKEIIKKILEILMTNEFPENKKKLLNNINISRNEERAIGCMLGMAIGDSMGANYQFKTVRYYFVDLFDMGEHKNSHYNLKSGQWTNNTSMGLCLADSLLMNNGKLDLHDLMRRFICWRLGGYNNSFRFNYYPRKSLEIDDEIDYIKKSFYYYVRYQCDKTKAGDMNTSGNGSITRNAAVPIIYHNDMKLACEMSKRQSLATYQGLEAKECCCLLSFIIVKIFHGENLRGILDNLGNTFKSNVESVNYLSRSMQEGNDINRNWNWKNPNYRYSPERTKKNPSIIGSYVMDNMAMSLHIIYYTESFKEALIKTSNLGGDSSSVASVVGQIAGAYYSIEQIPGEWISAINCWDNGEIALRGYMLARLRLQKSFMEDMEDKN